MRLGRLAGDGRRRGLRRRRRRRARHYLLGLPWELAVLLGAVTSPTDAAAVFSVLRVVPLPKRLTGAARGRVRSQRRADRRAGDPGVDRGGSPSTACSALFGIIVYELVAGVAIGLAVGFGGAWVMRRAALPSSGLYPLAVLTLCLPRRTAPPRPCTGPASPRSTSPRWCSATWSCPHRAATRSFAEGVAWLAQIGLFVMLGLLLSPGRITLGDRRARPSLAGLVLTFVARPLSVLVSAVVQPMPWRELAFISWAGLRGAVPIVLTTIPLGRGRRRRRAALRHRLRDGRDLHAADRTDAAARGAGAQGRPALGAARARDRGGPARTGRGRPAPGHDQPGVHDARRRGRRAAAARRVRRCRW